MKSPLIYLVAGEASGDALGAGLMRALRERLPDVRFAGVGGESMQREGLQSLFPYSELSIMGFLEVVPHIPAMLRRLRETALDILEKQPAAVITLDSPGFNFRLARALKNNPRTGTIRRIHYVAPTVWAYKPGRARKTADLFHALLALLPFEPPYFEKEGLPTSFVGHPVIWEEKKGDAQAFRARHRIAADTPLLLVLPGSRAGEVCRHMATFLEAAKALPNHAVVILAGAQVRGLIQELAGPELSVIDIAEKYDAFAAADIALSKSGTVTIELAVAGVPTVMAYKVSALTAFLVARMVLIQYASLVNIALNKEIIPEFIQQKMTPQNLAAALKTLTRPEAAEAQRADCAKAIEVLRGGSRLHPNAAAAEAVLRYLA